MSVSPWSTDKASPRRDSRGKKEDMEEKDTEEKGGNILLNWEEQNTLHTVQNFLVDIRE